MMKIIVGYSPNTAVWLGEQDKLASYIEIPSTSIFHLVTTAFVLISLYFCLQTISDSEKSASSPRSAWITQNSKVLLLRVA